MFRYLERSENTARLVDAGVSSALSQSDSAEAEWTSILDITGMKEAYKERHEDFDPAKVVDFMLRERTNPFSVLAIVEAARTNARMVRTALTREVFEATNECWIILRELMARQISAEELYTVLRTIRQQSALVRGAMHGTKLRNDIYDFASVGTFIERANNTASILEIKYYALLPAVAYGGYQSQNVQWETILRSVSAQRSYRWLNRGSINQRGIAEFLIMDPRMPQSMAFCISNIVTHLQNLANEYGQDPKSLHDAVAMRDQLSAMPIDEIFENGLREFVSEFLKDLHQLSSQIEQDFRFYR
jgi:uncharacterized alpha-E superfamily protein